MSNDPKNPDGSWKYTNALIDASSAYLQQHAHNPIQWYGWSEEVLVRAKKERKLIFVSIGYSSCYWCHVMEREVFCREDVAAFLAEHFIAIKVDREQQPHIDEAMMVPRQLLTGEGGWPNNAFLTPEALPFFAGGTFAAEAHQGGLSFLGLLQDIVKQWQGQPEMMEESAEKIAEAISRQLICQSPSYHVEAAPDMVVHNAQKQLLKHADHRHGGFFSAPKFPQESYLLFLLEMIEEGDDEPKEFVKKTLSHMAEGGMFDMLAGGFHRYSVDDKWLVPHFEKMLYNQALLGWCYSKSWHILGREEDRQVAEKIYDFVLLQMRDNNGGFYSAIDAETDAVEGQYYLWDAEEVEAILGQGDAAFFFQYFDLAHIPDIPGHPSPKGGVIYRTVPAFDAAKERQIFTLLLAERVKRKAPFLDKKIIVSWNGMMISSLLKASQYLENPLYEEAALQGLRFVKNQMESRTYFEEKQEEPWQLEDYAFVMQAALDAFAITQQQEWHQYALALQHQLQSDFCDVQKGGYFQTKKPAYSYLQSKNAADSATPAAASVMLHNLRRLHEIQPVFATQIEKMVRCYYHEAMRSPLYHVHFIHGLKCLETREFSFNSGPKAGNDNERDCRPEIIKKDESAYLICWELCAGEYLYAPQNNKDIQPIEFLPVDKEWVYWPKPDDKLVIAGKKMPIYSGMVAIGLTLPSEELLNSITLRYQLCCQGNCALPQEIVLAELL